MEGMKNLARANCVDKRIFPLIGDNKPVIVPLGDPFACEAVVSIAGLVLPQIG
ncbi:MAG TPA: hypothetical protein VFC78_15875 [Tepidisphaeraceae bacterium]|nr:hypothetical protein [Tepidisphaeraceae bacterium]